MDSCSSDSEPNDLPSFEKYDTLNPASQSLLGHHPIGLNPASQSLLGHHPIGLNPASQSLLGHHPIGLIRHENLDLDGSNAKSNLMGLSTALHFESANPVYNDIHNLWGMLELSAMTNPSGVPIHFVLVIDTNQINNLQKLFFIERVIECAVNKLGDTDLLSIISFNATSTICIMECVANKQCIIFDIMDRIRSEETNSNTERSDGSDLLSGLNAGIKILQEENLVSTLILLTDLNLMDSRLLQQNLTNNFPLVNFLVGTEFITIAYGLTHLSSLLCNLTVKKSGTYFYAETVDDVETIFDSHFTHMRNITFRKIQIDMCALDGARLVNLTTLNLITENLLAKKYTIELSGLAASSPKTILFKLSVRSMIQPCVHKLLSVCVSCTNNSNETVTTDLVLQVIRPAFRNPYSMPGPLDVRLNKQAVLVTMTEVMHSFNSHIMIFARTKLEEGIMKLIKSTSNSKCAKMIYFLTRFIGLVSGSYHRESLHIMNYYFSICLSERFDMGPHIEKLLEAVGTNESTYWECATTKSSHAMASRNQPYGSTLGATATTGSSNLILRIS